MIGAAGERREVPDSKVLDRSHQPILWLQVTFPLLSFLLVHTRSQGTNAHFGDSGKWGKLENKHDRHQVVAR